MQHNNIINSTSLTIITATSTAIMCRGCRVGPSLENEMIRNGRA